MTQRLIVFTDPDDNTVLAELGDAHLQLSAVDSQPALAGAELHRFVGELFRRYAAPPLLARIAAAAAALDRARAEGLPAGVRTAVDHARAAVAAVHDELAGPPVATVPRKKPPARRAARAPIDRRPNARAWQRPAWLPAEIPVDELLAYRRGA